MPPISKPHPRKGTETMYSPPLMNCIYQISKPHPRKGTETFIFTDGTRAPSRYFKTTSPQGDGNMWLKTGKQQLHLLFQNHIPARGRKRSVFTFDLRTRNISKPHPRKGTETTLQVNRIQFRLSKISKPHPRKGTETRFRRIVLAPNQDFKTTSPQGDGNLLMEYIIDSSLPKDFKTISPQGDGNPSFLNQ